jgi:acyl-CoA synthetase (NDP forming)
VAHRLDPLLNPRSIALVGASNNPGRIGGMPLDLLRHFGYAGEVFPINPKYEEVFGYRCYPDVESLPKAPDLVVLAIGKEDVTPMLERCHALGARAAIVYAAGFAEEGAEGAALQARLESFAETSGMVVAGPNCMGLANLNLNAYTAFAAIFRNVPRQTEPGRVSVVTQSGNVCSALFGLVRKLGVPVSHFINGGNEANVEFAEYLDFLAQDEQTDCVVGYIEQLRDGERFVDAALAFARQDKPLVLYKAGETEKGSEAVRSHTSALAGDLDVYRAAFRQLNVIAADDFAQMADLAWLSGFRKRSGGKRVAIVTMSGAMGAILSDKLILAGLEVPTLPEPLQNTLRSGIPDYGMVSNPVDVTGNIVNSPDFVRTVFSALATSDAIDTVIVNAPGYLLDRMAEPLAEVCAEHDRLFVAVDTGAAKCREQLAKAGVPVFDDIGRAMRALVPFIQWMDGRAGVRQWDALRTQLADPEPLAADLSALDEFEAKRLLAEFGVPSVAEAAAGDADAAAAAAERIGYPVVLKILSPDIAHKTEIGGVKLNLVDSEAVRAAFAEVTARAREAAPQARLNGVLIQKMSKGLAELIVGVTRDPVFGAVLTVGLGGVLTELYRDVSHRLLPIDTAMAQAMLRELKAFPLLDGFRGSPKGDVAAACGAIAGLSTAAQRLGAAVAEIEVNPLQVKPAPEGVAAIDALLLAPKPSTSH